MPASIQIDRFVHQNLPPPEAWPELILAPPDYSYPDVLNCAERLLDRWVAEGAGDRPAVRSKSSVLSYRDLWRRANQIARVLVEDLGIVPGNRVLIRGGNSPELAAIWFAVQKAGAVAVTTMPLLRATELRAIIAIARPSLALCEAAWLGELAGARSDGDGLGRIVPFRTAPSDDGLERLADGREGTFTTLPTARTDVSLIGFTSGTTGKPKATVHFHQDVMAICDGVGRHIVRPTKDDVFIGTPPFGFTFGLGGLLLFPLYGGGSTVLIDRYEPAALLDAIAEFRATVCFTAPTFYRRMAGFADRGRLASLRLCVASGEPLALGTRDAWAKASGLQLTELLGSTEMLHAFVAATAADIRPGKIGCAVPGYRIAVLDEAGRERAPGEIGRLAVKGPTGCRYLDDPRQADYVQNGWNVTGDHCAIDDEGYVTFHARADDMIITSGYNVSPIEVEDALLSHYDVAECVVVGVPDAERGQRVKAFVVAAAGARGGEGLARDLQAHVKDTLAPYKYPREIAFVESLPRNAAGKLQRFALRAARTGKSK